MPTPAILHCPTCGLQHVEKGKWARFDHRRHLCYGCGAFFEVPAPNVGVERLDGPHAASPASPRKPGGDSSSS